MFILINKWDMYLKFFEIEEEFVCYDWIDNFKGYL